MKAKKNLLNNRLRPSGACLPLLVLTISSQVLLADNNWVGGTSADWNDSANWSGAAVPNGDWTNISTGTANVPIVTASPLSKPGAVVVGNYSATGRLDHTAGLLSATEADWPGGPMLVGYGDYANGTYNIADTTTTGGALTGYGTGTGSFTTGAWGDIRVAGGYWWNHSTAVMNINTSGTVHANGNLFIAGQNGDVGTLNVDAGTVTVAGGWQNSMQIACVSGSSSSTGSLNISGGTVTLDYRFTMGSGSTSSTRTGAGTVEDPYVYEYFYSYGTNVATMTITGGTLTTDATNNDNWRGGLSMASAFDGSTGGTATVNLDGGTLNTLYVFTETNSGTDGNGNPFTSTAGISTFNFNGGTLTGDVAPDWMSLMGGLTRANVRNGGAVIDTNGNNRFISQMLEHSDIDGDAAVDGGLTKKGAGRLQVNSAFTYTGDTKVDAGTLSVQSATFDDASAIRIASGAILDLNTTAATDTVGKLYFGAAQQAAGTWGATGSGATHIDDTHFTGNGVLSVTIGPVAGYTSWASANGATGQTMDQDHDGDGVKNGVEYFMGQTGSTFTANPAPAGGTVTWSMSATYTGVYGTDYEVQTSTDLVTWTQAPVGTGDNTVAVIVGTSVVYDMPTGGKSFVRLVVHN